MNEQSGFITLSARSIYATAFLPDAPTATRTAVLIVEPTGEEKRAAYRMLVRLARALADRGASAMKFDLSGTGDSTLPFAETTFTTWRDDTIAAARELMKLSQAQSLVIIGARAGALVAAAAALELKPGKLILAEPILSGSEYLNDLERRQKIKDMMSGAQSPLTARQRWDNGSTVDFGGYEFNQTLANELQNTDLKDILPQLDGTDICAIRVSASTKIPPAWGIFGEKTAAVQDKPFWGQLDYYESDAVNNCILDRLASSK